jgi:quercetin dioxygenase-like cupin family protein
MRFEQPLAHLKRGLQEMHMRNTAVLLLSVSLAGGTVVAQDVTIKSLLSKDLAGTPGKELSMIMVDYLPGASDPVHTHNAQAMV